MSESLSDIGVVGLGVMGRNLALNIADQGFGVRVFNRTDSVTQDFMGQLQPQHQVQSAESLGALLEGLKPPRRLLMMVSAGKAVDAVLEKLKPLLASGDIVIDGGNSHYTDTDRRAEALAGAGVQYLGVGISGGEAGARHGPSMMPGGPKQAYEAVRPIFEAVAARADGRPCVAHLGPGSAGHYVKMVHNGIEYAFMQLIAESYGLLKAALDLDNDLISEVYSHWQTVELASYLMEITAKIFLRRDEETGGSLIDVIQGAAGQKGTGMWTSRSAMDLGVPVPNIDVAVSMRNLSSLQEEREVARKSLARKGSSARVTGKVKAVRAALYSAMVVSYAQGFALLQSASKAYGYGLDLSEVASIWRGGCIIRSALLRDLREAFARKPDLANPLLTRALGKAVVSRRKGLSEAVCMGVDGEVPVPGMAAALSYVDAYRAEWLPTNLIQAQRDFFGAHTYRRVDREGVFHTHWTAEAD